MTQLFSPYDPKDEVGKVVAVKFVAGGSIEFDKAVTWNTTAELTHLYLDRKNIATFVNRNIVGIYYKSNIQKDLK